MTKPHLPIADRFMKYVEAIPIAGCWLWSGAITGGGYGALDIGGRNGKSIPAHRISWELFKGKIPDGMFICHRCDVRSCVNPLHLFLGTQLDNVIDCVSKGRHAFGEKSTHMSKLTEEEVLQIKRRWKCRKDTSILAREYGISTHSVRRIVIGKTWAWLEKRK
jgi:hypothetical protein